jgi:hypothetical protein
MNIWMTVTPDEFELPLAVAETVKELAYLMKVTESAIYSVQRQEKNHLPCLKYKVRKVKVEGDPYRE